MTRSLNVPPCTLFLADNTTAYYGTKKFSMSFHNHICNIRQFIKMNALICDLQTNLKKLVQSTFKSTVKYRSFFVVWISVGILLGSLNTIMIDKVPLISYIQLHRRHLTLYNVLIIKIHTLCLIIHKVCIIK